MNRYEEARHKLGLEIEGSHEKVSALRKTFKRLVRGVPRKEIPPNLGDHSVQIMYPQHRLFCLVTVDDTDWGVEEHISITRRELDLLNRSEKVVLPTWDDVVLIRALAWADTEEIYQVLPALSGPKAEFYINVIEALHLQRLRK